MHRNIHKYTHAHTRTPQKKDKFTPQPSSAAYPQRPNNFTVSHVGPDELPSQCCHGLINVFNVYGHLEGMSRPTCDIVSVKGVVAAKPHPHQAQPVSWSSLTLKRNFLFCCCCGFLFYFLEPGWPQIHNPQRPICTTTPTKNRKISDPKC